MNRKPFLFGTLLSFVALLGTSLSLGQPKQVEASATIETPVVQVEQPTKNELLGDSNTHYAAADKYFIVDVHDVSSWWYDADAHTYIDFVYNNNHTVYDTERVNDNLDVWSFKPSSAIPYNFIIIVRGTDGFAPGADWSKKWNQTLDLYPSIESPSAIRVQNYKEWPDNEDSYRATFGGDEILANEFGRYFLSQSLCKDEGGMVVGAGNTWTRLRTIYQDYVSGRFLTSGYLSNYVLDDSDTSNTANMLRRYEAIVAKNKSYGDYMSRGVVKIKTGSAALFANSTAENGNYTLIIILGSLALIATAAIFMHIKRRED